MPDPTTSTNAETPVTNVVTQTSGKSDQSATSAEALPSASSGEIEELYRMFQRDQNPVQSPNQQQSTPQAAPTTQAQPSTSTSTQSPSQPAKEKSFAEQVIESLNEAQTQTQTQTQEKSTTPSKPPARSFEGLTPEEATHFNNMSREAYDTLYPIYLRYKQHAPSIDKLETITQQLTKAEEARKAAEEARFYDHDEAYRLHPDFQKLADVGATYQQVHDFWDEQLALARDGKPFRVLTRDAQGRLMQSAPVTEKPDGRTINYLERQRAEAKEQVDYAQRSVHNLAVQLKQQYIERDTQLKQALDRFVPPQVRERLKTAAEKEAAALPKWYASRIDGQLLAYGAAMMNHIVQQNIALRQQLSATQANANAARAAGPTEKVISDGANPNPVPFSVKEYQDIKGRFNL